MKSYALLDNNLVVNMSVAAEDWQPASEWVDVTDKKCNIGDTYDASVDQFIAPKPWPSWVLDVNYNWEAPTPMPIDGALYSWNEETLTWEINQ